MNSPSEIWESICMIGDLELSGALVEYLTMFFVAIFCVGFFALVAIHIIDQP